MTNSDCRFSGPTGLRLGDNRWNQIQVGLTMNILTQFSGEVCQAEKNLLKCHSNEQSNLESY